MQDKVYTLLQLLGYILGDDMSHPWIDVELVRESRVLEDLHHLLLILDREDLFAFHEYAFDARWAAQWTFSSVKLSGFSSALWQMKPLTGRMAASVTSSDVMAPPEKPPMMILPGSMAYWLSTTS